MRFSNRGLDGVFTYPCTKADVREAFGSNLLDVAWFGGIDLDHSFNRRETPGDITGRVVLTVSVSSSLVVDDRPTAYFHAYRVHKEEWSDYLHWQTREIMRIQLCPWIEAMFARPETAWGGSDKKLVELREGALRVHQRRAK